MILDIKQAFEQPISQVRKELQSIDEGCPTVHHLKPKKIDDNLACTEITKLGHPLHCFSGMCSSKLRVLSQENQLEIAGPFYRWFTSALSR